MTPSTTTQLTALLAFLLVAGGLLLLPRPHPPRRPRRGRPPSPAAAPATSVDAALALDLVAAVVEAGAAPLSAVGAVGRVLGEAGSPVGAHLLHLAAADPRSAPPVTTPVVGEVDVPLRRCLQVAEQTGAPVVALLRAAADEVRRRRRRAAALAAARLGVRVVAPLGLCTLPAFALLAVLPVLLSLGRELLG